MKYRYGIITDFTVDKTKETITVYFSFYRRNKKRAETILQGERIPCP